jgi:hypothetical protein
MWDQFTIRNPSPHSPERIVVRASAGLRGRRFLANTRITLNGEESASGEGSAKMLPGGTRGRH